MKSYTVWTTKGSLINYQLAYCKVKSETILDSITRDAYHKTIQWNDMGALSSKQLCCNWSHWTYTTAVYC